MISIQKLESKLVSLVLGVSAVLLPLAAIAAERIAFSVPPFGQFYVEVDDLEAFATTGEISAELAYYLNRLPPRQVAKLPELLSTPIEFNPLTLAKFSNSTIGEAVIENFGKGIRADIDRNGFYALRGAIIAAAFDREGFTVINLLREFPLKTVYIDLEVLKQYIEQREILLNNRQAIEATLFSHQPALTRSNEFDLKQLQVKGEYTWYKQTLSYQNPRRPTRGYFDLYLPEIEGRIPLAVVSHGLGSNRQTFAYLAQHLVSHGFAVAVIEHNEISFDRFDRFLSGLEKFPKPNNLIDRPLDIKYVLDRLEGESNNLNLQQVGIIGQSFGGYASLALAGGELIADDQAAECQRSNYRDVLLDLSSLAKCTFNQLNRPHLQLRDPRIKAVIAINPLGKLFGRAGMSSIEIPTMLVSGTHDLITPPVAEQIKPFVWLNRNSDKYLVLVKPGTHFSFLQEGLGILPVPDTVVGPSPTSAYPAIKALSTAFFKVHLAQQPKYRTYLQSDRVSQFGSDAFELTIIRSLTKTKLKEIVDN